MRRIRATAEIKALKTVIYERTVEVIILRNENDELRKQLAESRAKEGKGALEKMIDGVAEAVAGISKMFSTMSPDDLKALVEANDHDLDADCPDDCDFDCEHCERSKLDEEDDTNGI